MKKQLLTLQQLLGVMDPELYRHLGAFGGDLLYVHMKLIAHTFVLEKTDGLNLFFCFRYARVVLCEGNP